MIAFSINAEVGYAIISISDRPTLQDYIDAARALSKHENFYPSTHRICDFTPGELSASLEEVAAFVEEARKLPTENSTRVALVAKTDHERALLENFSSQFEKGRYAVFAAGHEALSWIYEARNERVQVPRDKVRVHRLLGDVNAKDVLRMQAGWYNEEGFDRDAPILWDLREARLRVEVQELIGLADNMMVYSRKHRPDGRAAVLVSNKLHEAILKSGFQRGISEGRLRLFWSEADAYDFLLAD